MSLDRPSREVVMLHALDAVKKAKNEQAILNMDVEIGRILGMYPDSPMSADELTVAIIRFCSWVGVSAQVAPVKSRHVG
jgi:hypothetical protein